MYWLDTCPGKLLEKQAHLGPGRGEFRASSLKCSLHEDGGKEERQENFLGGLHLSSGFCRGTHVVSGCPSSETRQCLLLPGVEALSWPRACWACEIFLPRPPAFCRPVLISSAPRVMGCPSGLIGLGFCFLLSSQVAELLQFAQDSR